MAKVKHYLGSLYATFPGNGERSVLAERVPITAENMSAARVELYATHWDPRMQSVEVHATAELWRVPFNPYQQLVVDEYDGGSLSHVTSKKEAKSQGDSLFTFLIAELATEEDCDSLEEAMRRVEQAIDQLMDISMSMQARLTELHRQPQSAVSAH